MSESTMRSNLVKALKPLDAVAIESRGTGIGIPDVNYVGGWIECKWMRSWPVGAYKNPVRFPHPLSIEQGIWLKRRVMAGGVALVCCQVAQEWFFFDGMTIRERFDKMNRLEMELESVLHMPRGLEKERLIQWLRSL